MINEFRFQSLTTHHHSTQTLQGSGTDPKVGNILDPCFARDADASCNLAFDDRVQDAADEVLPTDKRGWLHLSASQLPRPCSPRYSPSMYIPRSLVFGNHLVIYVPVRFFGRCGNELS